MERHLVAAEGGDGKRLAVGQGGEDDLWEVVADGEAFTGFGSAGGEEGGHAKGEGGKRSGNHRVDLLACISCSVGMILYGVFL